MRATAQSAARVQARFTAGGFAPGAAGGSPEVAAEAEAEAVLCAAERAADVVVEGALWVPRVRQPPSSGRPNNTARARRCMSGLSSVGTRRSTSSRPEPGTHNARPCRRDSGRNPWAVTRRPRARRSKWSTPCPLAPDRAWAMSPSAPAPASVPRELPRPATADPARARPGTREQAPVMEPSGRGRGSQRSQRPAAQRGWTTGS